AQYPAGRRTVTSAARCASRPPGGSPQRKGLKNRPQVTQPLENRNSDLDAASVLELRRLARSRPKSGREAAAQASATRTLERLGRERRKQVVPPMPAGWYPHDPGDPFYELDWV